MSISRRSALAAESMGARVHGPIEQAKFLRNLGIEQARRGAHGLRAAGEGRARSTAPSAACWAKASTEMGKLFKVIAIADPALGALPGFESIPP